MLAAAMCHGMADKMVPDEGGIGNSAKRGCARGRQDNGTGEHHLPFHEDASCSCETCTGRKRILHPTRSFTKSGQAIFGQRPYCAIAACLAQAISHIGLLFSEKARAAGDLSGRTLPAALR